MILETMPALGALTVDQKLRLAQELWQDASKDCTIPPGVAVLLDERLKMDAANPGSRRTTDEVTAGLMALKQRMIAERS
jgi:hypothetical protein